jgi:endoglucanase
VEAYVGCNPPNFTVADQANNLVYSEHCYFDGNNSGTYPMPYDQQSNASPTIGVARVTPFITWLRAHNARACSANTAFPTPTARIRPTTTGSG